MTDIYSKQERIWVPEHPAGSGRHRVLMVNGEYGRIWLSWHDDIPESRPYNFRVIRMWKTMNSGVATSVDYEGHDMKSALQEIKNNTRLVT